LSASVAGFSMTTLFALASVREGSLPMAIFPAPGSM
jgi:hypothetical protein